MTAHRVTCLERSQEVLHNGNYAQATCEPGRAGGNCCLHVGVVLVELAFLPLHVRISHFLGARIVPVCYLSVQKFCLDLSLNTIVKQNKGCWVLVGSVPNCTVLFKC